MDCQTNNNKAMQGYAFLLFFHKSFLLLIGNGSSCLFKSFTSVRSVFFVEFTFHLQENLIKQKLLVYGIDLQFVFYNIAL